jgi:O-acetyl-ADP-ribose deacetylase (regulator of RNase III)
MFVVELQQLNNPRFIVNFPTKQHWREKSRIENIQAGLADLVRVVRAYDVQSVAIPPLGSGLGGLDWNDVRPLILQAFADLPHVDVRLYEPLPEGETRLVPALSGAPTMTPGRAALLTLMGRYLSAFMDVGITLLEIHKLMYFMQEAGEPLRLRFKPAYYGPYAENLRHVLRAMEGQYISGYSDEDDPKRMIELRQGAAAQAEAFLADNAAPQQRYARVAELIEGFETPFGMELLATVHWVVIHQGAGTEEEISRQVYAWNRRKRMFTPEQIAAAHEVLQRQGWLTLGDNEKAAG